MEEKITYIAFDGKEFTNKEECQLYEADKNHYNNTEEHILFLDEEFEPLVAYSFNYCFSTARFIIINDVLGLKILRSYAIKNEIPLEELPQSTGLWFWSYRKGEYLLLNPKWWSAQEMKNFLGIFKTLFLGY